MGGLREGFGRVWLSFWRVWGHLGRLGPYEWQASERSEPCVTCVFHFWAAFYSILLCWRAFCCIFVYFLIVSAFLAAFDCFCGFWQHFAA